ncbi:hypothetical protein TRFO_16051 [Tritrichomonas foetus]|uniref:DUF4200 domain-containing protein n=1 Tax=Tritrichomonas foetus TaxID=1144522 RepID=A0A1J4KS66_9EUKA|nr:hypothetical protein TRFO_16051 [Tritrichomonas foetus]|eukprot:OHT13728.1 hypothetical protein TRFO_16051 [Tritrichomonas foetus]
MSGKPKEISWKAQKRIDPIVKNPLKEPNPFALPTSTDIYQQRDDAEDIKKKKFKKKQNMTIMQRALPEQPVSSRRTMRKNYEKKINMDLYRDDDEVKPVGELRQRQQHTNQLIQEQRELFLSNLLISRHKQEIERLQNQKETKENKLNSIENDFREQQNIMKTSSNQNENTRNRYRKRYEEQLKRRIEVGNQVKKKKQQISAMETEITKLEETLSTYQGYDILLQDIARTNGERPKTTEEFLNFFDKLENEDLFIVQHVDSMRAKTEETEAEIDITISKIEENLKEIDLQIESLLSDMVNEQESNQVAGSPNEKTGGISNNFQNNISNKNKSRNDQLDIKGKHLQKQIGDIFRQCFKSNDPDQNSIIFGQNSLSMLSLIETQIESMTRVIKQVDPLFIAKKLKLFNEKKRKEQREANQRKKELEQKRKIDQMKERATKPVKRKDGRPLVNKVMIMKITKKDPEERQRELMEKARIEELLYGNIFD